MASPRCGSGPGTALGPSVEALVRTDKSLLAGLIRGGSVRIGEACGDAQPAPCGYDSLKSYACKVEALLARVAACGLQDDVLKLVHRHLVRRDPEDDAFVGVELRGEGGVIGIGLPAVGGSNSAGGPNA